MTKFTLIPIVVITLIVGLLTACGSQASSDGSLASTDDKLPVEESPMFGEPQDSGIVAIAQGYFSMKDALVQSSVAGAQASATKMLEAISESDMDARWEDIKMDVAYLADASEINQQRDRFSVLSEKVFILLSEEESLPAAVYRQYCPMAQGNKGAYWISLSDQIRNPYFGDKMLNCGEVVATL